MSTIERRVYLGGRAKESLRNLDKQLQQRFRKQVKLLLQNPFHPSLGNEKLRGYKNLWSIRINDNFRVIYSNLEPDYFIHLVGPHDIYRELSKSIDAQPVMLAKELERLRYYLDEVDEQEYKDRHIYDLTDYLNRDTVTENFFDAEIDLFLQKSYEQEQIIQIALYREPTLLIEGPAGTGKTTCAIFLALEKLKRLKNTSPNRNVIVYLTYSKELKRVFDFYSTVLAKNPAQVLCFTFDDLVQWIASKLNIDKKRYKTRSECIEFLRRSFSGHENTLGPIKLYDLIYSIKTACGFDSRRRAERKVDAQERMIQHLASVEGGLTVQELTNYFNRYEELLKNEQFLRNPRYDRADLLWVVYEQLNSLGTDLTKLFGHPFFYVIVDETQDLRELEIELILLLSGTRPELGNDGLGQLVLFGDPNQQIMPTAFNWYNYHRLLGERRLFRLSKNYRNTLQIARVDKFLYTLCNDENKLWPNAENEGPKPIMIIGQEESDWLNWLKEKLQNDSEVHADVGIVSERDDIIKELQDSLVDTPVIILDVNSVKGLEFEDMILIRLFGSIEKISQSSSVLSKSLRDSWHVLLSRARTNLLVYMNQTDYMNLSNRILPDAFNEFLGHFIVYEDKAQWEEAWNLFISRCSPDLPGFARILFDCEVAKQLWKQFLKEKKTPLKVKAYYRFLKGKHHVMAKDYIKEYIRNEHLSVRELVECYLDLWLFAIQDDEKKEAKRYLQTLIEKGCDVQYIIEYIFHDETGKIKNLFKKHLQGLVRDLMDLFEPNVLLPFIWDQEEAQPHVANWLNEGLYHACEVFENLLCKIGVQK
ncbi:MAG: hypothetical protein D6748_04100 [Calditrichaeota bacterium]|nr:MAG: hypothetical protein D6748_04100 [Calditrichota bacterium]